MIGFNIFEWIELVLRWSHFIVGIAWIGASFYFNWLENRLERENQPQAIAGELWSVHGGGFYHVRKLAVAPAQLPPHLHWFKWEAYATWFTGLALLVLMFYLNAEIYLLDASLNDLTPLQGTGIGVASLVISWIVYDVLCRSPLRRYSDILTIVIFVYFSVLAYVLCQLFSGRGAFIHVGASIGTIMVLNVMAVIIPSQKSLVDAVKLGSKPDSQLGQSALTRSRHNNYLTLPVLFIMISSHYPSTFSGPWNWLILIGLSAVGILVRHYFNVRHLPGPKWPLLVVAGLGLIAIVVFSAPKSSITTDSAQQVTIDSVRDIIHKRCTVCHSAAPVQAGFLTAPGGIIMDSDKQITDLISRIFTTSVATRSMPIGNISQMTEEERSMIAAWYTDFNRRQLLDQN